MGYRYGPSVLTHTCRVQWASVNSLRYKPGTIVALRVQDDFPMFSEVQEISLYNTDKVMLIAEEFSTSHLEHHYRSYKISKTNPTVVTITEQFHLLDRKPLTLHHSCDIGSLHETSILSHYYIDM